MQPLLSKLSASLARESGPFVLLWRFAPRKSYSLLAQSGGKYSCKWPSFTAGLAAHLLCSTTVCWCGGARECGLHIKLCRVNSPHIMDLSGRDCLYYYHHHHCGLLVVHHGLSTRQLLLRVPWIYRRWKIEMANQICDPELRINTKFTPTGHGRRDAKKSLVSNDGKCV